MITIAILHHDADFDGLLSNEVCRHFLHGAQSFGCDLPAVRWSDFDAIYIVDLSNDELMNDKGLRERITWIDHHKSAIDRWDGQDAAFRFNGIRVDGVAACRLAWNYFTSDTSVVKTHFLERIVKEPRLVQLAGEYDVWDLHDPDALPLQAGLRQLDTEEMTQLILDEFGDIQAGRLEHCLDIGRRAQKAKEKADAGIVTKNSHDVRFEGLTFLCCNNASFNSQLFAAAIKPHHDALMGWRFDGQQGRCTISLYHAPGHEHHDLSQIAVKYGGGGHKGACGFQMPLPQLAATIGAGAS